MGGKRESHVVEKYSYLIGQKINKWTILNITKRGKQAYATCRCECGTVKDVRVLNILYGYSKDCGCGRKAMLRETRTKNLVGQRFGKLTVVELLEDSNKFNRRVYKCKCDCGKETTVPSGSLLNGHTSSCGCLISYWNMHIDKWLTGQKISHIPEYPIVIDDVRYRFDFYLPDYNLFIEYDGEQHYEPVQFYGHDIEEVERNFKKTQEHDKIKNDYCKNNNINLLRIPYWETKNIETIISNHLQRLNEKGIVA